MSGNKFLCKVPYPFLGILVGICKRPALLGSALLIELLNEGILYTAEGIRGVLQYNLIQGLGVVSKPLLV